jgi:RimJ/RimL family protein N-acetyltransferase
VEPIVLRTSRLVLDQPGEADLDDITRFCQDPVMARFMTLPAPYRREDAAYFVDTHVPAGWSTDAEMTWAIRRSDDPALLGMIAHRAELADLGYWLGRDHRGHGFMTEAVGAVLDRLAATGTPVVNWECLVGNTPSAAVARRTGFAYVGTGPSNVVFRDGSTPPAWHGVRDADRPDAPSGDWPEESF